jgi:hypothetical protein
MPKQISAVEIPVQTKTADRENYDDHRGIGFDGVAAPVHMHIILACSKSTMGEAGGTWCHRQNKRCHVAPPHCAEADAPDSHP